MHLAQRLDFNFGCGKQGKRWIRKGASYKRVRSVRCLSWNKAEWLVSGESLRCRFVILICVFQRCGCEQLFEYNKYCVQYNLPRNNKNQKVEHKQALFVLTDCRSIYQSAFIGVYRLLIQRNGTEGWRSKASLRFRVDTPMMSRVLQLIKDQQKYMLVPICKPNRI